ncbi:LuxR family transcriptional regulator [Conexibacter sp. SYSU D00693]|uniref:LuxR family transcriptional regulator n=1 Tax=Conexibacter sp. SYSU D00693 TaxID=2812560 RepID=UPI00196B73D5|nr:LuxR family transcriptional regulator [Conexibacter sp. SYSU D00693]
MFPQTKFHPPPPRDEHVERSGLLAALADGGPRLVVVSAPGGFGKSTLLAQWAARSRRVAWVSLDAEDAGRRLWLAVLTALKPVVGPLLDPVVDAAEAPATDQRTVLVTLLDVLAQAPPTALVLDDAHVVLDDPGVQQTLDWLLGRLPPGHRLVVATRRDLTLPAVTRLRSQGDVLDVRADDLRFDADDAQRFLAERLGLGLDAAQAAGLAQSAAGWPAALYLAALRLRAGDDLDEVAGRLAAGDEALVGDLAEEVLRSCGRHERRLVLETSVLERFTADLCVRLLGDEEATRAAFASLTRSSLLVTPLDRTRTWFSCHQLLRDALRARLVADQPDRARELHLAAGAWLESEGGEAELQEAMGHYLAAREWDLAAELLACHSIGFVQSGALGGRARGWLSAFPPEVAQGDARVCFVSALLAALSGDRALRDRWLALGRSAGWDGPMPDGTASFALATRCLEALVCFDDLTAAVGAARRALTELPPAAPVRAAVEALTAWHLHLLGRPEEAAALARDALAAQVHLPSPGLPLVAYLPRAVLALSALERDDVVEAEAQVAAAQAARDGGPLRGSPHALPVACATSRLLTALGRPAEAAARARSGLRLARGWRDSSLMVPTLLVELTRACAAAGDADGAREAAADARAVLAGARDPGALVLALEDAAGAGRPRRPASADDLSGREVEVLRALAATGSLREVAERLFISRNTIKTHTRALYAKLGVGSREGAIRRARELGLLDDDLALAGAPDPAEGRR